MIKSLIVPLFGGIGGHEVLVILLIVLLLFGGKKIPELMKGVGKGIRSFKDGMNEVEKEVNATPLLPEKEEKGKESI